MKKKMIEHEIYWKLKEKEEYIYQLYSTGNISIKEQIFGNVGKY